MVVHRQRGRGRIHNAEALVQNIHVGQLVVLLRVRIDRRIGIVNAVNVLRQQDNVRADLSRTQHRCGISREERTAGAAAEDDDAALFQMTGRTRANVRLCDLVHLDSGLYANVHAALLQRILKGKGVDGGREHTHMVCARALHLAAAVLDAAPEVAAADNDADLTALLAAFLDHVADRADACRPQGPRR